MLQTKENALKILEACANKAFDEEKYEHALVYCNRYINLEKNNPDIYNLMGYTYRQIGGLRENVDLQIECFEKALSLEKNHKQALRNLALVYPFANRFDEAKACFQKLFTLNPIYDDYVTYAYLMIKLGDFEEGFKYYEYRFPMKIAYTPYPKIDKPLWNGENIENKNLLVHYEQGFGDSIQFARYVNSVKPFAKNVIFRVQDELLELFLDSGFNAVGMRTPLGDIDFDYHIPLMSIIRVLHLKKENIPFSSGYLKSNSKKVQQFKEKYFNNNDFKIGISWYGMKNGNKRRNIPLNSFKMFNNLKNVKLYSIQKGYGAEQLKNADLEITDVGQFCENFSDTAAMIENMDIFISSDNCVFNLAGAMGKKSYLLLNKFSEWRWFLDEEKTPWYDSVKIFKKKDEHESWENLLKQVCEKIKLELNVKNIEE